MSVGGSKNNESRGEGITWVEKGKNIKVLGIYFNASDEASNIQQNWTEKLNSIKTTVQKWAKRNLSLKGKVNIAKTFLLSKLNYALQALSLTDKALAEIDRVIFKFLWQKKYSNKKAFEKVKRNILCRDPTAGELGAISVKDQQNALHLRWFKEMFLFNANIKLNTKLATHFCKKLLDLRYLAKASVMSKEIKELSTIKSKFWEAAVRCWIDLKNFIHVII